MNLNLWTVLRYRIWDALHKVWPFRRLLCRMGRHDFELMGVIGPYRVLLICHYCERKKDASTSAP